mmetsp:Transcript_25061/g.81002  ORF Transcript_25061/g.81002 Transcript_25061/m.81002 type:complete len:350 (+) Transcript_25061:1494-2543(+)
MEALWTVDRSVVGDFPLTAAPALVVLAAIAYWQSVPSTVASFVDSSLKHRSLIAKSYVTTRPTKTTTKSTKKTPGMMTNQGLWRRRRRRQESDDFQLLPDEVFSSVLSYVAASTAAESAAVCRRWRRFVDSDDYWKVALMRDFCEAGGTKDRYSKHALAWLSNDLVGANEEGAKVYVGLHGSLYDVTAFVPHHPGATDTLLDHSGTDATIFFEDVGHSTDARRVLRSFLRKKSPKTGFLRQTKRNLDLSRKVADHAAPAACLRCGHRLFDVVPRLFFDLRQDHWRCWWPCCRQVVDLHVDARPRLAAHDPNKDLPVSAFFFANYFRNNGGSASSSSFASSSSSSSSAAA